LTLRCRSHLQKSLYYYYIFLNSPVVDFSYGTAARFQKTDVLIVAGKKKTYDHLIFLQITRQMQTEVWEQKAFDCLPGESATVSIKLFPYPLLFNFTRN